MKKKELLALKESIVGKKQIGGSNEGVDGKKTARDEIIGKVLKELKEVLGWELSEEDRSSLVSFLNNEISKNSIEEDGLGIDGVKKDRIVFCPLFDHVKE